MMVLSQYSSFVMAQRFVVKEKKKTKTKDKEDYESVSVGVFSCSRLFNCPGESRCESRVLQDVGLVVGVAVSHSSPRSSTGGGSVLVTHRLQMSAAEEKSYRLLPNRLRQTRHP